MRIILFGLIAATASAGFGQRMPPVLPFPPRGVDYVETVCSGGIDGRYEVVRVLANGDVMKATRRMPLLRRARASRDEMRKIWRDLDLARFEQRVIPAQTPTVMDGINCKLTRRTAGREHSVTLIQQVRGDPKNRDLAMIVGEINVLGGRAAEPGLKPAAKAAVPRW